MHVLFANTGVQLLCIPLSSGRRYTSAQIGYGWQYCRVKGKPVKEDDTVEPKPVTYAYIQWQIVQGNVSKLYLAVDTSLGDPEVGYFCDPTSLAGDFNVNLENILGITGEVLPGLPKITLVLRAATATAGDAKPVHMVVDFGNSRTGALLLELSGEISQAPQMMPFELLNRYQLDGWNDAGEPISKPSARWFSSKSRWCISPYLMPTEMPKKEYYRETQAGFFGSKVVTREREVFVRPNLFDDLSMMRMGREVDDISQIIRAKGDFRIGVSSPKRYLWADNEAWLEGAFWHMADPHDRSKSGAFATKLSGGLLKYIHEDDRDFLLEHDDPKDELYATEVPVKPRHAPRSLMTASLYEMLCQAYMQINSLSYRSRVGDAARSREIRSLTMTFPSGMFEPERRRYARQAQKAINIFARTLGKNQRTRPSLTFSIDEASAVHLTYIWSELAMLGQDPRLWFAALARQHSGPKKSPEEIEEEEAGGGSAQRATAAGRTRNRGRLRPGEGGGGTKGATGFEEEEKKKQEIRIACLDIGGGTSDMMIAKYTYEPGIDDSIHGQVLHQDGISIAGDQLVKRLLEKLIVPAFAEAIGLEQEDVQLLFGPEVPKNRGFGAQRIDWINRIFVPLAESYLQLAVDNDSNIVLNHDDPEVVDPAMLESLEQVLNKLRGPGYYNLHQDLGLNFNKVRFEEIVHEVFDDLIFDFCCRAVDQDADVILLAGQPTKLGYIQQQVRKYVPLPASRVIGMFNHYAGTWYPYQDPSGRSPGLIVDPKSAVVVGAAIEFLARNGVLSQFRFSIQGKEKENSYFWGVMTMSNWTIREERVLFRPVEENTRDEWVEFNTTAQRVVLGRKMMEDEAVQASPIYVLKMDTGDRIGETNVTIRIRRSRANDEHEEELEIDSVTGTVAGHAAVLGENVHFNWRTLSDDRYYLDTGGLDNIELPGA